MIQLQAARVPPSGELTPEKISNLSISRGVMGTSGALMAVSAASSYAPEGSTGKIELSYPTHVPVRCALSWPAFANPT